MITRMNAKVEKALREAMGNVPHVEVDQITAPLAGLDDNERTDALTLAMLITCYVMVYASGVQWPVQATVRQIAGDLATTGLPGYPSALLPAGHRHGR